MVSFNPDNSGEFNFESFRYDRYVPPGFDPPVLINPEEQHVSRLSDFQEAVSNSENLIVRQMANSFEMERMVNFGHQDEVYQGVTALGIAAIKNDVPMIRLLLACGADIQGGLLSPELAAFANSEEAEEAFHFIFDQLEKRKLVPDLATLF